MRTGRYRFRAGWFGGQVLQVEVRHPAFFCGHIATGVYELSWIDASSSDAENYRDRLREAEAFVRSHNMNNCLGGAAGCKPPLCKPCEKIASEREQS